MSVSTPTALVAAAPTLFRQGLLTVLREQCPELAITLTTDAGQTEELATRRGFGLIVLDGALPGPNLPNLLDRLHRTRPTQRLLVLADAYTLGQSRQWHTRHEAQLFIPSQVPPTALAAALAPWLTETAARPRASNTNLKQFSRRELEVLRLVVDDYCNEDIASRLFINVRTVESHRRNLLQKAGTRTLVGLAARAVREGWVA